MRTLRELTLRLSKLEGSIGEPLVILIRAFTGGELASLVCSQLGNRTWTRNPGESIEALHERASADAATAGVGVFVLREVNSGVPLLNWGQ